MVTPDALYQTLKEELELVSSRTTIYDRERVPLFVKKYACEYMLDKFLSKIVPKQHQCLEQDTAAYKTFLEANQACSEWKYPNFSTSCDEELWNTFTQYLQNFFLEFCGDDCELSWSNIALEAKSGPGVAVGANGTTHYGKFYSGPLCATDPFLLDLYRADIRLWPEESNAEIIRELDYGSPLIVKGSNSSFVPKTVKTSRMIGVEPAVNVYYQLGLASIIQKRLLRLYGIDLRTQPSTNRYLAYLGSIIDSTRGDGFATIDLSSASDRLSLAFASEVLPPEWLSTILALRSSLTSVRIGADVVDHRLCMVSMMGNGFTFPFQTAVFASAAAAAVSLSDNLRKAPRSGFGLRAALFSVFGDDIVIRAGESDRLLRLLQWLGAIPNPEKTFTNGGFRESCGHDYFHGFNVRPVFVRRLDDVKDLTVLANLLVDWSVRLEIQIPRTLEMLVSKIRNVAPMCANEDEGLRVPYDLAIKYGSDFGVKGFCPHTQSLVYTRRFPRLRQVRICDGVVKTPRGAKRLMYNPSGLHMAFLRGEIRNSSITIRGDKALYRSKLSVAPNWDYRPSTLEDDLIGSYSSAAGLAAQVSLTLEPVLRSVLISRKGE